MTETAAECLVHAEYCGGPFYMGWWLYVDPIEGGAVRWTKKFNGSLWVQGNSWGIPRRIHDLAARHGIVLPEPGRHCQKMAEAFDAAFPNGIVVAGTGPGDVDWGRSRVPETSLIEGGRYGGSKPVGESVEDYDARCEAEEVADA